MHKFTQTSLFIFLFLFFIKINAQNFDKKYTNTLAVDKTVSIAIKTANTSIKIVTWNKDKVAINAAILVNGLSQQQAEKYLNNWRINVVGNAKKINISTKGDYGLGIKNEVIVFNSENAFEEASILQWRDSLKNVRKQALTIFKQLKLSKNYKKRVKKNKKKLEKHNKKNTKKGVENVAFKTVDSVILNQIIEKKTKFYTKQLKKSITKKHSKKYKKSITRSLLSSDANKVILKKIIILFVPKKAKINFNTRYCNITIPTMAVKGRVFYGDFNARVLTKSNLKILYANVKINKISNSKLILHNVKKATINLIDNTTLKSNSTNLVIDNVIGNVNVDYFFGKIRVLKIENPITSFYLKLNNSEALLNVDNLRNSLTFGEKKNNSKTALLSTEKNITLKGKIKVTAPKFFVEGKFSTLIIH